MHFIGVSELAGAIGLLVPRARPAAAFALFLMMIGGLVTHLTQRLGGLNTKLLRRVPIAKADQYHRMAALEIGYLAHRDFIRCE